MIKFYSTGCPTCNQLKLLMDSKGVKYEYISNIDLIMEIANKQNIMSAPFAEIDGVYLNATQLKQHINTL